MMTLYFIQRNFHEVKNSRKLSRIEERKNFPEKDIDNTYFSI